MGTVFLSQSQIAEIERDKDSSTPENLISEIRQRLEEAREELLIMEHQIEDERYQKEQARKESLEWKTVFLAYSNFYLIKIV